MPFSRRRSLRPGTPSLVVKQLPFQGLAGSIRRKDFPASSPATPLFNADHTSTITAESHELGSKSQHASDTPESCATKVFVRVRPFNQRELAKSSGALNSSPSSSQHTSEPIAVVQVDVQCPSRITTLDPDRDFTPKDTYVFENCFNSSIVCARTLEESEGGVISRQEIEHSVQDQVLVYLSVGQPVLQNMLEGYNGCVFAYGQTGSGKTYTMMGLRTSSKMVELPKTPSGPSSPSQKATGTLFSVSQKLRKPKTLLFQNTAEPDVLRVTSAEVSTSQLPIYSSTKASTISAVEGIVPRLLKQLFLELHRKHQMDNTYSFRVEIEYYEIYNEKVIDLLSTETHNIELRVRNSPNGPYVEGLRRIHVEDVEEVFQYLKHGNAARHSAATRFNDYSSRSHAILTLHLIQMYISGDDSQSRLCSKINLVDLAGSERTGASGVMGKHFIESTKINLSLTALGRVIDALADLSQGKQGTFCPYRDSNLTWLLRDSFGGNSKTTMIATISPHLSNFEETCQTLRYASRAKQIVTKAVVNEDPQQQLIRQLRMDVERLQRQLDGEDEKFKDDYIDELRGRVALLETQLSEKKLQLDQARAEIDLLRTSMATTKVAGSISATDTPSLVDAGTTKGIHNALRSNVRKLEEENLRLLLTESELQTCTYEKTQLEKRLEQISKNNNRELKSLQSTIRSLERDNNKLKAENEKFMKLITDYEASEEQRAGPVASFQKLDQENDGLQLSGCSGITTSQKAVELSEKTIKKLRSLGLVESQSTSLSASETQDGTVSAVHVESLMETLINLALGKGKDSDRGPKPITLPSMRKAVMNSTSCINTQDQGRGTQSKKKNQNRLDVSHPTNELYPKRPFSLKGTLIKKRNKIASKPQRTIKQLFAMDLITNKKPVIFDVQLNRTDQINSEDRDGGPIVCFDTERTNENSQFSMKHFSDEKGVPDKMSDIVEVPQKVDLREQISLLNHTINSLLTVMQNRKSLAGNEKTVIVEERDKIIGMVGLLNDKLRLVHSEYQTPETKLSRANFTTGDFQNQELQGAVTQLERGPFFEAPTHHAITQKEDRTTAMPYQTVSSLEWMSQEEVCRSQCRYHMQFSSALSEDTNVDISKRKKREYETIRAFQLRMSDLCLETCSLFEEHNEALIQALVDANNTLFQILTKEQLQTTRELVQIKLEIAKLSREHAEFCDINKNQFQKIREIHTIAFSNAFDRAILALSQCAEFQQKNNERKVDQRCWEGLYRELVGTLQHGSMEGEVSYQDLRRDLLRTITESEVVSARVECTERIHQEEERNSNERSGFLTEELSGVLVLAVCHAKLICRVELFFLQSHLDDVKCRQQAQDNCFQKQLRLLQKRVDTTIMNVKFPMTKDDDFELNVSVLPNDKGVLPLQVVRTNQHCEQLSMVSEIPTKYPEKGNDQPELVKQAEVDLLRADVEQLQGFYLDAVRQWEQNQNVLNSTQHALSEQETKLQRIENQVEEARLVSEVREALLTRVEEVKLKTQQLLLDLSDVRSTITAYKKESLCIQCELKVRINELSELSGHIGDSVQILKSEFEKSNNQYDQTIVDQQETIKKLKVELEQVFYSLQEKEAALSVNTKELLHLNELVAAFESQEQARSQQNDNLDKRIVHLQTILNDTKCHNLKLLAAKDAELTKLQGHFKNITEEKETNDLAHKHDVETLQASLDRITIALKAKEVELRRQADFFEEKIRSQEKIIAALRVKEKDLHEKFRLQITRSIQLVSDKDDEIALLQTHLEDMNKHRNNLLDQNLKQKEESEKQTQQFINLNLEFRKVKEELSESQKTLKQKNADLKQIKDHFQREMLQNKLELERINSLLKHRGAVFEEELAEMKKITRVKDSELSILKLDIAHMTADARALQDQHENTKCKLKACTDQLYSTNNFFNQFQLLTNHTNEAFEDKLIYLMDFLSKQFLNIIEINAHLRNELCRISVLHTHSVKELENVRETAAAEKSVYAKNFNCLLNEKNQLSDTCFERKVELNKLVKRLDEIELKYRMEKDEWENRAIDYSGKNRLLQDELDRSERQQRSLEDRLKKQQDQQREENKNYQIMLEKNRHEIAELKEYLEFQASLDHCETQSSHNTSFCKPPAGYSSSRTNMGVVYTHGGAETAKTTRSRVGDALMSFFQRKSGSLTMPTGHNLDPSHGVSAKPEASTNLHLSNDSENTISNLFDSATPRTALKMSISLHDFIESRNSACPDTNIKGSYTVEDLASKFN